MQLRIVPLRIVFAFTHTKRKSSAIIKFSGPVGLSTLSEDVTKEYYFALFGSTFKMATLNEKTAK
jgi:hypothetical protein